MTTTGSVQHVGGTASSTSFFFFGQSPNILNVVQPGWYAQGAGVKDGLVISNVVVIGQFGNTSVNVTIESSKLFQSGQMYYFTSYQLYPPCFKKDTQILCFQDNKEVYRPIQDLRSGDLVKTETNGYLKIDKIGTSIFYNLASTERHGRKLYRYKKDDHEELTQDLYITGTHSILVDHLTDDQKKKTKDSLGALYLTGKKWRLMAFIDLTAEPMDIEGTYDIYHFSLENESDQTNYGIYANGLLVETCCQMTMNKNFSMRFL